MGAILRQHQPFDLVSLSNPLIRRKQDQNIFRCGQLGYDVSRFYNDRMKIL